MKSLQEEFKSGLYKIGNFMVHIVTNPITTLEGIRLNWDALQNPTEIKVFLSGLIGLMVFAAMPDDVIRNGVDSFNKKFRKTTDLPIENPSEEQEQIAEIAPEPIIEENTIVAPQIATETTQDYGTNPIDLPKPRAYQPSRLRTKGA